MWAGRRASRATAIEWGCTNSGFVTVTANQPPSLPRIRSNPNVHLYSDLVLALLPLYFSRRTRQVPSACDQIFSPMLGLHRQMNRCVLYLYKQAYMFIPSVHCDCVCDHEYRGTRGLERSPPPTRCFATGSTP